ncbi:MAG: S-methyl-5-thioribose-1-phosphate isomerase, partial [Alphaproteobacteria bacterium]|nr:S-methyl-5-thioribose-1-phosphate isomerase [Alphaproteobacteria bacterium]
MKVDGKTYRSVWRADDGHSIHIFDQTRLPHHFEILTLSSRDAVAHAIRTMQVRGAPLIGAVGAYGIALALRADAEDGALEAAFGMLNATRPTAVNLRWALERVRDAVVGLPRAARADAAYAVGDAICDEDV